MKFKTPPESRWKLTPKLRLFGFAILIAWVVFALQPYRSLIIPTDHFEMGPSLQPGQKVYLYQHDRISKYQKGDIIWYRPSASETLRWGTVIATAGERVYIKNGQVFCGENQLDIQGLPSHLNKTYPVIPSEHFFIAHANQEASTSDSLTLGPLSSKNIDIEGKLFFHFSSKP